MPSVFAEEQRRYDKVDFATISLISGDSSSVAAACLYEIDCLRVIAVLDTDLPDSRTPLRSPVGVDRLQEHLLHFLSPATGPEQATERRLRLGAWASRAPRAADCFGHAITAFAADRHCCGRR
jgi:hypothetical protein